jgi:PIN domain nuclease of toxin-antitoxin system
VTVLLDSNAFLWFIWADPRLSATAKSIIEDPANRKLFSVASVWEISIKVGIGKLTLGAPAAAFIPREMNRNGMEQLDISLPHATAVEFLPQHHRDPFDRLLVAQAQIEGIPIVSSDLIFDAYGVTRIW